VLGLAQRQDAAPISMGAIANLQTENQQYELKSNAPPLDKVLKPWKRAVDDAQQELDEATLGGVAEVGNEMTAHSKKIADKLYSLACYVTEFREQRIALVVQWMDQLKNSALIKEHIESYESRRQQDMDARKKKAADTRAAKKQKEGEELNDNELDGYEQGVRFSVVTGHPELTTFIGESQIDSGMEVDEIEDGEN
jgi:hypothetical protein